MFTDNACLRVTVEAGMRVSVASPFVTFSMKFADVRAIDGERGPAIGRKHVDADRARCSFDVSAAIKYTLIASSL